MRARRAWVGLVALLIAAAGGAANGAQGRWLADYEGARAGARREGKPLLVVFR